jgi:hypothetical protein
VIRLASSEWLRLRSRRLVRVLAALTALGIVVAVVIGAVQSAPPSAAGVDQSAMRAADLPEIVRGSAFISILIGLVIGASAVGASWQSGTMTTILTWEPRRVRVALVRAAVVAVGTFLLLVALLGFLVAVFWLATTVRGVSEVPSGWASDLLGVVARVSALAAVASIIGGAIAMVGRNTAAALGAAFVYLAVLEGIVRGLRPALGRFLLGDNIVAVAIGEGLDLADGTQLTPLRGAVTVAVYAIALLAVATVSFRMRDVQ